MVNSKDPTSPVRIAAAAGLLLCLAIWSGCSSLATNTAFYRPITAELQNHNFAAAVEKIETAKKKNKYTNKDRFLYYLDAGLAYHYASRFDTSNARLTKAEDAADELFTKSISRAALSLVLNDNVLEYSGEDYEILYSNLIMALNYMALDRFDDAFVEIKRANEKLNLLELKYRDAANALQEGAQKDTTAKADIKYSAKKVRFNNSAFARYLSMHVYAAEGKMDDARIDFDLLHAAFREQPHIYNFGVPDVRYRSPDKSILSVVGLVGLSPVKEALNLRIRTDKDLDLVQILYTDPERRDTEYGHIPMPISQDYYFKLAIPVIVSRPTVIGRIRVRADEKFIGELQLLEDVGTVAGETFEAKKSLIYLRSVARALYKGLIAHTQKKKADNGEADGWLKKLAIDAIADITENADLRCSRLLPGKIYVGDFEIEPGIYDFSIQFLSTDGAIVSTMNINGYQVLKKGLNLIEALSLN
ncbi:MAG: hypothetical protein JSV44_01120 [Candidatus Zixiibacteriota bacterium]|nr:MAG: hypothetical protein JSV44_01120 [candidate division Zixibacteria bacterium]